MDPLRTVPRTAPERRVRTALVVLVPCLVLSFLFSLGAVRLRWSSAHGPGTHLAHLLDPARPGDLPRRLFVLSFLLSGSFACLCALVHRGEGRPVPDLHGSARWATWEEIRRSGLLDGRGLHVGGYRHRGRLHHLRDESDTHLLTFAPTRSGKGVSIILPSLLTNPEKSFFVFDIKGENHALSSGWREKAGNRVIKLEPASPDSHRYNPLDEISWKSPRAIRDIQNLAGILTHTGASSRERHWEDKAREALTGLLIHALEDPERSRTLHAVGRRLVDPERDEEETLAGLVDACLDEEGRAMLAALLHTPERERGSILSTLRKCFELFADPVLRDNTSESDFSIGDLVDGEAPVTLYFVVQPDDLDRLGPLCRIFLTQLLNRLISGLVFHRGRGVGPGRHPLVLMLDEFASMKGIPAFESALAYMAGYGVRAHLIVQDLDQITRLYGRNCGILGNCSTRIAFAPNTNATAEYLSRALGTRTVVRSRVSSSGREWSLRSSRSLSVDEVARPLLTPEETMRLRPIDTTHPDEPGGQTLILREGRHPILGTRVLYFRDPELAARSRIPPAGVVRREV